MKHKLLLMIIFCAFIIIVTNINISFAIESNLNDELINIELIKNVTIKMEYEYDEETNQVTAKMISKVELKDTKPSWNLSADKKVYTKVFAYNTKYTTPAEDINGNIIGVEINVTQIDTSPAKVLVKYEYKAETNTVLATMKSNRELQDTKISWELSEDRKKYTFEFSGNTKYMTNVTDVFGNIIPVEINVTQVKKATIKTEYEYDNANGVIIAKIISDIPLKDTKPTWKLSEDRKIYTKAFIVDTHYTTPVEDISGNIIVAEVKVTLKVANIVTKYEYIEETNQVIAKIISDIPLKNTKPTWILSEDKLTYTKVFGNNTIYSTPVEDIFGNIINVSLKIDSIDWLPPEITIEYEYNDDETVTVFVNSNEKFGATKINWILSEDKLTYKYTFGSEPDYDTVFQDIHGNQTKVKLNFKMKKYIYKEKNSTITVKCLYINKEKVNVEIISSIKMLDTKPTWELSDDGYTYTKTFYGNQMYKTPIQNINGEIIDVNIIINMFGNHLLGIDVSKWNGEIDWNTVKKQGIDIAIPRIGFGREYNQKDSTFEANYSGARNVGIKVGTYLYSYATDVEGARAEAYNCLKWLNGRKLDLPVFYDLEDKSQDGLDKQTITDMAIAFCEIMYNAGYEVGVYANKYWLQSKIDVNQLPDYYDIWLAHYTGTTDPINNPSDYNGTYQMWQYTSTGRIDGINADVDINVCYKQY